jgi:2-methylisocitrate lyase-like PEP mutase family enzyme
LKEAGRAEGVDLVLNARTDTYLLKDADDSWRFQETVRRAEAYRDARADCLFVPGLSDSATIRRLLQESPGPLNVLAGKVGFRFPNSSVWGWRVSTLGPVLRELRSQLSGASPAKSSTTALTIP